MTFSVSLLGKKRFQLRPDDVPNSRFTKLAIEGTDIRLQSSVLRAGTKLRVRKFHILPIESSTIPAVEVPKRRILPSPVTSQSVPHQEAIQVQSVLVLPPDVFQSCKCREKSSISSQDPLSISGARAPAQQQQQRKVIF